MFCQLVCWLVSRLYCILMFWVLGGIVCVLLISVCYGVLVFYSSLCIYLSMLEVSYCIFGLQWFGWLFSLQVELLQLQSSEVLICVLCIIRIFQVLEESIGLFCLVLVLNRVNWVLCLVEIIGILMGRFSSVVVFGSRVLIGWFVLISCGNRWCGRLVVCRIGVLKLCCWRLSIWLVFVMVRLVVNFLVS